MTDVWITIGALVLVTAAIRASGPVALGERDLPPRLVGVIALLAPSLLAALVVTQTVGAPAGGELELDARVAGVAGAGAVLLGGASTLPAVALAASVTAAIRLVA
ncbi:MAG: AzlD domain-containing protein [Solirubrobacterales bacterium]